MAKIVDQEVQQFLDWVIPAPAASISDEGSTAVEEQEWRSMEDAPGGTFTPVQTLKLWTYAVDFGVEEEDGTLHVVQEIYCGTPTATCLDSSLRHLWFNTVGRLRIVNGTAYIDLD